MNTKMERKGVEARDQEGTKAVTMCVACMQARDEQQNMAMIYNRCHVLMINTDQEKYWVCLEHLPTQILDSCTTMGPGFFSKAAQLLQP